MKEKIFQKLKKRFSYLKLSNRILREHADNLMSLNFITENNIDEIVSAQKRFLEKLKRVKQVPLD